MSNFYKYIACNSQVKYYKPKRNDKVNISAYNTPYQFDRHIKNDIFIVLRNEATYVGCSGNKQKIKGKSTCHAFLVGTQIMLLSSTIPTLEKVTYDPKESRIYSVVSGELKQGDICLITTDNEVFKVVFS